MKEVKLLLISMLLSSVQAAENLREGSNILVEAEAFASTGGWVVDPQFMDIMGSPYLLAHGLGQPVADASTEIDIPVAGNYRVWVRTKAGSSPQSLQSPDGWSPLPRAGRRRRCRRRRAGRGSGAGRPCQSVCATRRHPRWGHRHSFRQTGSIR